MAVISNLPTPPERVIQPHFPVSLLFVEEAQSPDCSSCESVLLIQWTLIYLKILEPTRIEISKMYRSEQLHVISWSIVKTNSSSAVSFASVCSTLILYSQLAISSTCMQNIPLVRKFRYF